LQVIVLGAGRGTRLGVVNPGVPKPLLRIGGETLLDRQLRVLYGVFGELSTTIVVGFRQELLRNHGGSRLRYVENADFATTNTAASLVLAFRHDPQEALVVNGDVLLRDDAVPRVSDLAWAACEYDSPSTGEQVRVLTGPGRQIVGIGKGNGGVAEAIGLYRLSAALATAFVATYREDDRQRYYEDVLDRVLRAPDPPAFTAVRIPEGSAIEIDTPEDLRVAEQLIVR
jgi:choline kinase